MDSVLDFLFLRRLQLNYISPPICPVPVASATGISIPVQAICPLPQPVPPQANGHFLLLEPDQPSANCCTNVLMFGLYQNLGNSFVQVGIFPINSLTVCSEGTWEIFADLSNGNEELIAGPTFCDGVSQLTINFPAIQGVTSYRVTKNGVTVMEGFFLAAVESCQSFCVSATQITSDGESGLSEVTCISVTPAPSIVITAPSNGAIINPYTTPNTQIVASVTLNDNTADSVQFYDNGTPLGSPISAPGPYTFNWSGYSLGEHALTAVLTYNSNKTVTSNTVDVDVDVCSQVMADWIATIQANGGAAPSLSTQTAVCDFYTGLYLDGLLPKMMAVNVFAPDNLQAAFAPLIHNVGSSYWNNNPGLGTGAFGPGSLSVNGLQGNGTDYLHTGIDLTAFTDPFHPGMTFYDPYSYAPNRTYGSWCAGYYDNLGSHGQANNGFCCQIHWSQFPVSDEIEMRAFDPGNDLRGTQNPVNGYWSFNMLGLGRQIYAANSTFPHNQVLSDAVANTLLPEPVPWLLFATAAGDGSVVGGIENAQLLSHFAAHEAFTPSESQAYFNRVQTLRQALGGGYV